MERSSSIARETLIAELMSDMGKLLDRFDAVTPAFNDAQEKMLTAARQLASGVTPFKAHMVETAHETRKTAVEHITSRANAASAKLIEIQTRAMLDVSKAIVDKEVGPPLRQLSRDLEELVRRSRQPWWEDWASYAATAVFSAIVSASLVLHVVYR